MAAVGLVPRRSWEVLSGAVRGNELGAVSERVPLPLPFDPFFSATSRA